MKRTIIFALLAFGMLRSASAQITQPATLGDMPRAQFGQTYNNAFLNHTQARSNNISVKPVAQQPVATMQGTVFSNDLFNHCFNSIHFADIRNKVTMAASF